MNTEFVCYSPSPLVDFSVCTCPLPEYSKHIAYRLLKAFPNKVWLVGSEARAVQQGRPVGESKDTDFIVEGAGFVELRVALHGSWSSQNTFGGLKILAEDKTVDVWRDCVATYLSEVPQSQQGIAINIANGTILMTQEYCKNPNMDRVHRVCRIADGGVS